MKRLPARAWLLLSRGGESLVRDSGTRDAAQVAFYVLMSFPSALLLVVWAASIALDDPSAKNDIVQAIVDALPLDAASGRSDVEKMLNDVAAGAGALGVLGAVSLLYSASSALAALRHAVNEAWGVRDRPFVPGKAVDLGLTLAIVPLGIAGFGLIVLRDVSHALTKPLLEGFVSVLLTIVVPALLMFTVLCIALRVLPAERASLRAAWPGALAGVVGLGLVYVGTRIYFGIAGGTGAIYGTIGALLAVSFSVYLGAIAVIYGAHVAAAASKFANVEAMDREIDSDDGDGRPLREQIRDALLGLVFRRRGRRDSSEP